MNVDGVEVKVVNLKDFTEEEAKNYIDYVRERTTEPVKCATTEKLTLII